MTGSIELSEELNAIKQKQALHEQLLTQNSETLREVKEVLVKQAVMAHRMDSLDSKLVKIEEKVEANHTKIVYWSGGIAAIFSLITILAFVIKVLPVDP